MCFNPAVTDTNRFSLYPLGLELKVQENAFPASTGPAAGGRVIDGYSVYEKFLPMYDRLFGARYVGRPLTELRINQDLQRAEQFFENVGFYQSLNDPNGPVYLIPYGAYLCGGCSSRLNEYWSIVKSTMVEQPFAPQVTRLGGPAVFGSLILKPRIAEDGNLEQVYDTVVFFAPPSDPTQVRLRPLPLMLNYEVQPPAERIIHDQLVYYDINGGPGHNVPVVFDTYIAGHGGRELAGAPLTEVMLMPEGYFRQCFENYCLAYDKAAANGLKVRMLPLGKEYLAKNPPPEDLLVRNLFTIDRINLVISSDKPTLNDNEEQVVRVMVQQKDSGLPMERVEATLIVHAPGKTSLRLTIPPTDPAGMALVTIPAQIDLPNGSRLIYEVCLNLPSDEPICAKNSYLIWNVDQ
jgi:hypothetical protein